MRILLADDDELYRTLLTATLGRWGYSVDVVEDGEQAFARLTAEDAPTLAILDWMMPRLPGPEVCRRLRSRPGRRYCYLLLITARDRVGDLVAGLEAGADDYLTKPFDVAELRARLRAAERILELQEQLLKSRQELEELATHDSLTHIWNRRAILDRLEGEAARAQREGKYLAAILLDVDHFKDVNDTHGHLAGDQVLCEVARRIGAALRPYDMLGRFGGEEFLITLTSDLLDAAQVVAERLRAAVNAAPVRIGGAEACVSISAGVAVAAPGIVLDPKQLLHAADEAMYRAKREGRNRISVATFTAQPAAGLPAAQRESPSPATVPPSTSR